MIKKPAARKGHFATEVIYKKNNGSFSGKRILVRFKRLAFREAIGDNVILPHRHLDYEVILLCQGKYITTINDVEISLSPGEGVLVNSGDLHQDQRLAGAKFIGLAFTLELADHADTPVHLFAAHHHPSQQKFKINMTRAQLCLRQIYELDQLGGEFTGQIQDALAAALFWQILEKLPPKSLAPQFLEQSNDGNFKDKLTQLLQNNLGTTLDLYEIAAILGMSRTSLVNKCKELFQMPPGKVFGHFKMEQAQYYLANSTLTVKEISAKLGYASEFAFSRAFRKHVGCPPRTWRCNYIFEK